MRTTLEKKNYLLVPSIVGCFFGLVAGYAAFAVTYEYSPSHAPAPQWLAPLWQALLAFSITAGSAILLFGVIPMALHAYRTRKPPQPVAHDQR